MKINVLQLIGSFHTGGSERQAVQLVRLLKEKSEQNVFVATLNGEGVLRKEVEELGFKEIPEFPLTSFYDANFFRQIKSFARFLQENKIDVIQASDFYTNVFGMLGGRWAKTPVRIAAKRDSGTKTAAQQFLERRSFNFADAIVVNAEAIKHGLMQKGISPEKLVTIYNGLNLEKFDVSQTRQEVLRELALPTADDLKFITIVANFRSDVKNQKMFLRAAQKVKESNLNARYVLAGEGELLATMKEFANEVGVGNETFFTGRCADVEKLLSVSDICVLSSRTEGFSNSILEYMAAAKPVVATNVGGASEAVIENETGFLVESDDDEAMAKHLIKLLNDPKKAANMGKRGRAIVEQSFSMQSQLDKNLALYEKLLPSKNTAQNSSHVKNKELVK